MQWSAVNQQWYCPKCEIFHQPGVNAPHHSMDHLKQEIDGIFQPKPKPQIHKCNRCGTPLNWIAEYGRWFCYVCGEYK